MSTVITVRVSERQKDLAKINAEKLGLNLSSICRMLVNYVAETGEIPSELLVPNSDTLQAIADMEKGKGVTCYETVNDLKKDLGWYD